MDTLAQRYTALLKRSVIGTLYHDVPEAVINPDSVEAQLQPAWFEHFWFGDALTMSSGKRLDNLQMCIESCLRDGVAGDIAECGAWRGGAAIFMRGILAAHGVTDRTIWIADSFQGLPTPPTNSVDESMYNFPQVVDVKRFRVDLAMVKASFARYGLLDEQVQFLPGWFNETLPAAPIEQLAVLRLDGDYYDSTVVTLNSLYPKVAPGGYIIIDDWGIDQMCGEKQAVLEYRAAHGITDEIVPVDYHCAYWRKPA